MSPPVDTENPEGGYLRNQIAAGSILGDYSDRYYTIRLVVRVGRCVLSRGVQVVCTFVATLRAPRVLSDSHTRTPVGLPL